MTDAATLLALADRTEAGARAIAISQGHDPDDFAPRGIMCTGDNQPVPWWKVFEEQAEACLAATDLALRQTLRDHWLTSIACDHENKTDVAHCYCTVWASQPMPTVGAAVEAWIDHVLRARAAQASSVAAGPK